MSFFSIVPRIGSFINHNDKSIPLTILRGTGVNLTPGFGINVTDLNKGYKQFTKTSESGDKFTIKVLFKKDEPEIILLKGEKLTPLKVLNYVIRNAIPVMVHTEAIDVEDGDYLITKNPSRDQTYKGDTVWELEFTTYVPLNLVKYANDNTAVLNAIKKSKKKNNVKYKKLKDCGYKNLKYSKKKKVVKCVKVLQEVLYKNKCLSKKQIDGWYGKTTKAAVKKYQKKYNKKYKVTNVINKNSGGIMDVSSGTLISGNLKNNNNVNLPNGTKLGKENKTTTVLKGKGKLSKKLPVNGKVDKATWIALYQGD